MVRGLYTAATGAIVAQSNVDVIANNLANVNTSGFKRTLMQVESQPKMALFRDQIDPGHTANNRTNGVAAHVGVGNLGFGSRIYDTPADFEQGALQQTGNPLDVALSGPGFLSVRDAAGALSYIRGGSFVQNARNQLVTSDGDTLLATNGRPLILPPQPPAPIDPLANAAANAPAAVQPPVFGLDIDRLGIVTSNGVPAGQLAVSEFAKLTNLRPQGANKFVNAGPAPLRSATQTTVLQGAQEKSNAQVISSMVGLIANERWFDVNQKMMQTQDTAVGQAIQTVGKSGVA